MYSEYREIVDPTVSWTTHFLCYKCTIDAALQVQKLFFYYFHYILNFGTKEFLPVWSLQFMDYARHSWLHFTISEQDTQSTQPPSMLDGLHAALDIKLKGNESGGPTTVNATAL